jgi:hypothetical protein
VKIANISTLSAFDMVRNYERIFIPGKNNNDKKKYFVIEVVLCTENGDIGDM